ncbi:hypothetical protein [Paracoccus siganidrum]|nr:hypothetical protein [Paracoccus siganidrum]
MPLTRRLAAGTALAALLALPASAQTAPAPAPGSFLSPANIAAGLLRAAVSYGRILADIRYGAIEADPVRGGVILRDLQVNGLGDHANCHVSLGRLELSGLSLWYSEHSHLRIDAGDLSVANNCFGPNAAMIGVVTGTDHIPLASLAIDLRQSMGSGAAVMDIEAVSPGIARIEASADFDHVSIFSPDLLSRMAEGDQRTDPFGADPFAPDEDDLATPFGNPSDTSEPSVGLHGSLRAAHLTVENLGVWERVNPMLPPDIAGPQGMEALVTAPPGTPLHQLQQGLAEALKNFVAQPGRITAEIRPQAPIAFDSTAWTSPEDAAALFMPAFSNALPTPPLALIADPQDASDPRALGLALARGEGVPRNTRRALELLTPLQDDPEIALALADLLADSDPAAAYVHALQAAATGTPGAMAALDRAEARLATADLLAAQPAADSALEDDAFASAVALREAALARAEGRGQTRSYGLAWRLATLAAAAGDSPARALMDRLQARFGDDPAWIAARAQAADAALEDWTDRDLATTLAAR